MVYYYECCVADVSLCVCTGECVYRVLYYVSSRLGCSAYECCWSAGVVVCG